MRDLDPFSRHYKDNYIPIEWTKAYGEDTPLARYWQPRPIPGFNREMEDRLDNYSYELLGLPPVAGEDEDDAADEEYDDEDFDDEA
jgi:hypothetical protein